MWCSSPSYWQRNPAYSCWLVCTNMPLFPWEMRMECEIPYFLTDFLTVSSWFRFALLMLCKNSALSGCEVFSLQLFRVLARVVLLVLILFPLFLSWPRSCSLPCRSIDSIIGEWIIDCLKWHVPILFKQVWLVLCCLLSKGSRSMSWRTLCHRALWSSHLCRMFDENASTLWPGWVSNLSRRHWKGSFFSCDNGAHFALVFEATFRLSLCLAWDVCLL